MNLAAGTYRFTANVFPDLVTGYEGGHKVWAQDPTAGEIRFLVGSGGSGWQSPVAGQKNSLTHTFTLNAPQTVRLGVAFRSRYALPNNGWFMDDWSLVKVN